MFELIENMLIGLLTSIVNASKHIKCISWSYQKCMIQPTLINLHPDENSQELHGYPFAADLDKCVRSYNTFNGLCNKACVPNKTEDLNISVFKMISGINELKTLSKRISCERKCKLHGRKFNSNQKWNDRKCRRECKKYHICEKDYIWNPPT